jgi:hypothetical protein
MMRGMTELEYELGLMDSAAAEIRLTARTDGRVKAWSNYKRKRHMYTQRLPLSEIAAAAERFDEIVSGRRFRNGAPVCALRRVAR